MCVKTNHRLLGQLYTQKWLIFHLGNLTPAKIEEHWLRPPLLPEKLPMQSPYCVQLCREPQKHYFL